MAAFPSPPCPFPIKPIISHIIGDCAILGGSATARYLFTRQVAVSPIGELPAALTLYGPKENPMPIARRKCLMGDIHSVDAEDI